MGLKSTSQLKDFIKIYKNILSSEVCDLIVSEHQIESEWMSAEIGYGTVDTNQRSCQSIDLSAPRSPIREEIEQYVFDAVGQVICHLHTDFDTLNLVKDTGYDLLRYKQGQFYHQHVDHFDQHPRSVSCSILLNDDYEGGEFAFFDSEVLYSLNKGDVITFPSNHLFPHAVKPVTKGVRYSIVTWLN